MDRYEKYYQDLSRLVQNMETLRLIFTDKCIIYIREWNKNKIEGALKISAKTISQMEESHISEVKAKLAALDRNIPNLVTQHLGSDTLWIHKKPTFESCSQSDVMEYLCTGRRPPTIFDRHLRIIFGHLGTLLQQNNLADGLGWEGQHQGVATYTWGIIISPEMESCMVSYARQAQELFNISEMLRAQKKKDLEVESINKWNDA